MNSIVNNTIRCSAMSQKYVRDIIIKRSKRYHGCSLSSQYLLLQQQQPPVRQNQQVQRLLSSSCSSSVDNTIKIVEVGPRDGLQNESSIVSTNDKVTLVSKLIDAGCSHIEVGSFVSKKWVPTMADSFDVVTQLQPLKEQQAAGKKLEFSSLVPNVKGLEQVLQLNSATTNNNNNAIDEIAIFISVSEEFSQKNLNCSIDESLERYKQVIEMVQQHNNNAATKKKLKIRGYLSCVLGCPYSGHVPPKQVANVLERILHLLGQEACFFEYSLGDTIGVGTPTSTQAMLQEVQQVLPLQELLAVHFHDTYGQALVNIHVALEQGIRVIDSSIGGLGGCPYAKGASGNVATEDVVYMLDGMGFKTGIDLNKLLDATEFICHTVLDREPQSKVAKALLAAKQKNIKKGE